jgi:hypothetical protein
VLVPFFDGDVSLGSVQGVGFGFGSEREPAACHGNPDSALHIKGNDSICLSFECTVEWKSRQHN